MKNKEGFGKSPAYPVPEYYRNRKAQAIGFHGGGTAVPTPGIPSTVNAMTPTLVDVVMGSSGVSFDTVNFDDLPVGGKRVGPGETLRSCRGSVQHKSQDLRLSQNVCGPQVEGHRLFAELKQSLFEGFAARRMKLFFKMPDDVFRTHLFRNW